MLFFLNICQYIANILSVHLSKISPARQFQIPGYSIGRRSSYTKKKTC